MKVCFSAFSMDICWAWSWARRVLYSSIVLRRCGCRVLLDLITGLSPLQASPLSISYFSVCDKKKILTKQLSWGKEGETFYCVTVPERIRGIMAGTLQNGSICIREAEVENRKSGPASKPQRGFPVMDDILPPAGLHFQEVP